MAGTTDTVKAILTPGEFVIRKEAVDMIGVPTLEKLNDMPEAGGHSEIDRLIAQATLKNMTGMYGGGMVNAKQYGHGGMVNKYEDGGQAMSNLKPVPDNNPGLAKLPENVRNKMGYMQDGGLMEMMHGGKAKKKKEMYGYQEGGEIEGINITPEGGFQTVYKMPTDDGDRYYLGENLGRLPNLSRQISIKRARDKAMNAPQDSITFDMAQQILNPEEEKGGFLKKLLGMQEGGAVQDSSMMMQANPFVPFDQRPPSSGEVMSPIPSGMEQGDMMRIIRDEREVLDMQDVELLRQKGKNFFEKLRLDSLQSKILDSLINQGSGDAMRIQRSPNEPFSFPNTPAQENFMQKYKEEMIDPTYFPEGN